MGFGVCVRELTQVDEREERKKERKQASRTLRYGGVERTSRGRHSIGLSLFGDHETEAIGCWAHVAVDLDGVKALVSNFAEDLAVDGCRRTGAWVENRPGTGIGTE